MVCLGDEQRSLIIREMQIKTRVRYPSRLSEWLSSNRAQITNVSEDVGKREPFCTVGEDVIWCSHCGKEHGVSSEDSKWNYHTTQESHSWVYIQKENKPNNTN